MSKFLLSHSAALDSSEKRWCNWRSCSLVQPMPGHHIPSTWFTCSGNIVWVLLYPWQWTPADALDPAPLTGWLACMDEAWALPWLVLSAPGMGSGSPLQNTQLAVCTPPPSHHAHACCIPHDWTCPPRPRDHAPVEWMSVPECLTDSHAMMLSFHVFATNVLFFYFFIKKHLQKKNLQLCNQKNVFLDI